MKLKVMDSNFLPKNISPEDELASSFGAWVNGEPVDVVLRFDQEIKAYILRKKWHRSQNEKELKDSRLEVSFRINGYEGIKQWIYRWIPHVEVIAPKKLRKEFVDELQLSIKRNT